MLEYIKISLNCHCCYKKFKKPYHVNEMFFLCVFMSYMFYIARSMPNTIKVNKTYTHKCMYMFLVLVLFASELDFVTQRTRLQSPLLGINLGT